MNMIFMMRYEAHHLNSYMNQICKYFLNHHRHHQQTPREAWANPNCPAAVREQFSACADLSHRRL
jgi:hypothetical protein